MSALDTYYYDRQFRHYIVQFAAVFAGIQVEVGKREDIESHLIHVPIKNASSDRVVAAIKGENTQNKLMRLPMMSFVLSNVDQMPEARKGTGQRRRQTYMPTGGLFPDDITVVEQRMPVPYKGVFELNVWASNQDQHYQMMEQILSLFDPFLQIQLNDEMFDWRKISTIELIDVRFEETIPSGTERRLIQSILSFNIPIHLSMPALVHDKFVKKIFLRVGAVGADLDNSYAVIADLDSQGIEYDKIFDLNDVELD
jgi:hypothetical protein